jgi:hypothetical protein
MMSTFGDTRITAPGPIGGAITGPISYHDHSARLDATTVSGGCAEATVDDERVLYAPAIMMPEGVGATVWSSNDRACCEGATAAADLASRFVPYRKCPAHVQAMLVAHANRMLERLMDDVRELGGG